MPLLTLDLAAVSVSISTLGLNLINGLYMFYYVKVFLLIYKIDDSWFKWIQSSLIIVHVIDEPLIGYIQDYACLWMRNRQRTILFSGPILALIYLIPWFNWYNPDDSPAWVPGLHLIVALTTWNVAYPFVNTAIRGLFFDISRDEGHRVKIVRYNEIANVMGTTALMPVDKLSYSLKSYSNFQYSSLVVAFVSTVCFIMTGTLWSSSLEKKNNVDLNSDSDNQTPRTSKSKDADDNNNGSIKRSTSSTPLIQDEQGQTYGAESSSPRVQKTSSSRIADHSGHFWPSEELPLSSLKMAYEVCKDVLANYKFWIVAGANFTFWFRTQCASSFLAIFTEILVSTDVFPTGSYILATYYTMCFMLPRVVLVAATPIAERLGTYKLIMITFVLTWINSAIGFFGGMFITFDVALFFLLIESILLRFQTMFMVIISDLIEEDTVVHQRKLPASTLIFTLQSSAVKSTISLAPIIVSAMLNWSGYKTYESSIRHAPDSFKRSVTAIACGVPAVNALLGFGLFMFYKSFRRSRDISKFAEEYEQIP